MSGELNSIYLFIYLFIAELKMKHDLVYYCDSSYYSICLQMCLLIIKEEISSVSLSLSQIQVSWGLRRSWSGRSVVYLDCSTK